LTGGRGWTTLFFVVWRAEGVRVCVARLWSVAAVSLAVSAVPGCSNDTCRVPIDQLGCAATFNEQVTFGVRFSPQDCPLAGACGTHLVWRTTPSEGALICVYDSSGQALVFGKTCSDVPLACGGFCQTGGQSLDVEKECDTTALPATCANADGSV
jgi:hypothetical protein